MFMIDKQSLKLKHLEFVQAAISRMSQNSFQMKNWTIVTLAALMALYADSQNYGYVFVSLVAVVVFWGLDGYYLYQERRFRELYDAVSKDIRDQSDVIKLFSMEFVMQKSFSIWFRICFSKTIFAIYGPIAFALVMYAILKFY